MKNILFLTGKNNKLYFSTNARYCNIEYNDVYGKSFLCKVFRHVSFLSGFSLSAWKKNISCYDIILCIDSTITLPVLKWIDKNKGKATVKLCFRNRFIENSRRWTLDDLKKLDIEIWSYSIQDCDKYGFKYYNQFVNLENNYSEINQCVAETYDLAYIGVNKNRHNELLKILSIAKQNNLNTFCYVVDDQELENNFCKNNKYMAYSEYLNIVRRTKVIIDLVSEENNGLTLRPIEAIQMEKKLITNFKEIKKYDFYNPENIWILNEDDDSELEKFINSPYVQVSEEILEGYTVNGWLRRIISND